MTVPGVLLLALSSCSHRPAAGVHVGGAHAAAGSAAAVVRVTFRESPVPGARVRLLRSIGGEEAASGVADREGVARIDAAPGRYFLETAWRADGEYSRPVAAGDRYAWFGGNPVFVDKAGGPRELFVGLEEFEDPPATVGEAPGGTGVAGRVVSGGAPVERAVVFAYHRTETAFRDLGFAASAPTGPDGSFVLDLPPGNYHLVVRKRASGGVAGPMRKGDLFGYYPANPVAVRAGTFARVSIPATPLKLRNAPSYSAGYRAAAYIEGRILGPDGAPKAGVYAALYDNPDLLNRPVLLSDVTGPDGRYRLPVPVPGTWFLGARSGYGGSPAPGDFYGRYEGNAEHSVTVREGDRLSGIDISVDEVW